MTLTRSVSFALASLMALTLTTSAEPLPGRLQGTWRITRVLPTTNRGCWNKDQAMPLVGSTLTYRQNSMSWRGGEIAVADVTMREVSAEQFRKENAVGEAPAEFAQLGIRSASVTEVDFQHEDADITGATTEVPGDSVLMAGPNRIVVSACGVYFEATRGGGGVARVSTATRRSSGR